MTQVSPEDFTEDFLEHYGVKGMRWGVRKERDSSSGNPKPTNRQIKTARANLLAKRRTEYQRANVKGKASIAVLGEFSPALSRQYRADPTRQFAFNMTTGEKWAQAAIAAGTFGMSLPYTTIAAALNEGVKKDQRKAAEKDD